MIFTLKDPSVHTNILADGHWHELPFLQNLLDINLRLGQDIGNHANNFHEDHQGVKPMTLLHSGIICNCQWV